MKLNDLRNKRGVLVKNCRDLLAKAEAEKRDLTTEEQTQYDAMFSDQGKIGDQVKREESLREQERSLETSTRRTETAVGLDAEGRTQDPEKRYQEIVLPALSKWFGRRDADITGDERRALQADLDVSGGYLKAPMQMVAALIKAIDNQLFIRQLATKFTITESDSLGAPSLDANPADAVFTGEIADASEDSSMSFGRRELKPHPLKKLLKVPNKLLRLAPNAAGLVMDRLAYICAVPQENAFLNGSGANEPLGVFTASANGISTGRDVSADNEGTAIKAENLINVKYSLKGQYLAKAQWVAHRDFFKRVAKLTDSEGQFLWQPGLVAGQPDRLLGMPVNSSEYAPSTFTSGLYVGVLGDFSHYWIADVLAAEIKRLDELYARSSQTGFQIEAHVDGMPVLEEAFARVKMG